jgi:hypothetical protein
VTGAPAPAAPSGCSGVPSSLRSDRPAAALRIPGAARAAALLTGVILAGCGGTATASGDATDAGATPIPGDLVFQESDSGQAAAVRAATNSRFGHVGVVHEMDGKLMVFEAVEPVRSIPWERWVAHGVGGKVAVKRLRDRSLTPADLTAMQRVGRPWLGKHYDVRFQWSDDTLYCSELAWKLYHEALGIDLVATRPLESYDLTRPEVKALIKARFGGKQPNPREPVVSPADLYDSPLLVTVRDDFAPSDPPLTQSSP